MRQRVGRILPRTSRFLRTGLLTALLLAVATLPCTASEGLAAEPQARPYDPPKLIRDLSIAKPPPALLRSARQLAAAVGRRDSAAILRFFARDPRTGAFLLEPREIDPAPGDPPRSRIDLLVAGFSRYTSNDVDFGKDVVAGFLQAELAHLGAALGRPDWGLDGDYPGAVCTSPAVRLESRRGPLPDDAPSGFALYVFHDPVPVRAAPSLASVAIGRLDTEHAYFVDLGVRAGGRRFCFLMAASATSTRTSTRIG